VKKNVLVLGGGDGLVARELLKYQDVNKITVVDIDPEVTKISRKNNWIASINRNSLDHEKVNVLNKDAFVYIKNGSDLFHIIIADLPDPNNVSLARLYSIEFYNLVYKRLMHGGIFTTQSTSPFFSGRSFWCIYNTLKKSKFSEAVPYHVYVPSFGDWGFIMASDRNLHPHDIKINIPTKYIDDRVTQSLFTFEKDNLPEKDFNIVSTMDNPAVMYQYLKGWKYWN
ncbi:MAG: spermidine synthase, partial [bacterium]|nr:spermidine synthase [bacterium]